MVEGAHSKRGGALVPGIGFSFLLLIWRSVYCRISHFRRHMLFFGCSWGGFSSFRGFGFLLFTF